MEINPCGITKQRHDRIMSHGPVQMGLCTSSRMKRVFAVIWTAANLVSLPLSRSDQEADRVVLRVPHDNPVNLLRAWLRGHSSAGRAPALQAGGRRFDPVWLHQV
jgi:hypothetical protein